MISPVIRRATERDLDAVERLLKSAGLPIEGVAGHVKTFFVAELHGSLSGVMGLEIYGNDALLRSAVVAEERRNSGIGSWLYDTVIDYAKSLGVKRLVLLTNTAEGYFARKGFTRCDAKEIRGPITSSTEFAGACPSTAVCMELKL